MYEYSHFRTFGCWHSNIGDELDNILITKNEAINF